MSQKRSRREYEADTRRQQSPFVVYGTPLPPLDENTRDDGCYVPVWKQEVTDDRGRKRLHGAFTGGFSAGYFNSVGSKEGWTPSTFVSSRSSRAKDAQNAQQQRIEDFMDEEDLREREESRQISTADGFAGFGAESDQAPHHALDDIFKPVQDTMGEKLLNKMGWKKGQGIGPRVRRRVDPNDDTSEVKEFPPEDSAMLEFSQKQDTRGLGFGNDDVLLTKSTPDRRSKSRTAEETSDDDSRPGLSFARPSSKPKKAIKSSGIGVGSLNDTGSDDEDPYEMGPKMAYNRVLGGEKKPKKSKSSTTNANPLLKSKPIFVSKKLPTILSTLRKCHDGKLPLTGFVLADSHDLDTFGAMSLSDERYKPPEVPEDWQPNGHDEGSDVAPGNSQLSSIQPAPIYQHQTAQSRANALKETPLPSKSVFDYLSPAARDRLVTASGKTNLPPALNEAPPNPNTSSTSTTTSQSISPPLAYPHLDPTTAQTAQTRLRKDPSKSKPYADDLPKQGRYKDFLRFSIDTNPISQRIPPLRAPTHKTDEDHLAELHEFKDTANLFRPATGFLASRFTSAASAAVSTDQNQLGTTSDQRDEQTQDEKEDLLYRPPEKPKDPAEEAAKMGMFGVATRSTIGFFPTKLVCRRFGVEMPSGVEI